MKHLVKFNENKDELMDVDKILISEDDEEKLPEKDDG